MEKSLAILMENAGPNTAKVNALKTSIRINKDLIEAKQAELTQTTGGADSLASKTRGWSSRKQIIKPAK